ncbi:MAG: hypothetical protein Q7R41_01200, partial [Phycisphaerales bacterium]|nr:hypothetical protein [Phycisphaerales bacterium]
PPDVLAYHRARLQTFAKLLRCAVVQVPAVPYRGMVGPARYTSAELRRAVEAVQVTFTAQSGAESRISASLAAIDGVEEGEAHRVEARAMLVTLAGSPEGSAQ